MIILIIFVIINFGKGVKNGAINFIIVFILKIKFDLSFYSMILINKQISELIPV